jgi:NitT/TauT family transport system permease protein
VNPALPHPSEIDVVTSDLESASSLTTALPSSRWKLLRRVLISTVSLAVCLFFWQQASTRGWHAVVQFQNIPSPTQVWEAGKELAHSSKVASHVGNSLRRVFVGFALASVCAISLGLVIGRFRLVNDALLPPLEILRPIPAVAWIPLAILMFTPPEQSMIFITFIGAFFPVLLSTIHGVESLDRRLLFAALTLGAGPVAVFREVILPGALPAILTGLSIGMGTSWFSLVTAEMISGQFGIGYFTWEAYTLQNYADIVLGMIAIGLLGMGSSLLVRFLGRRLTPWFDFGGNAT